MAGFYKFHTDMGLAVNNTLEIASNTRENRARRTVFCGLQAVGREAAAAAFMASSM